MQIIDHEGMASDGMSLKVRMVGRKIIMRMRDIFRVALGPQEKCQRDPDRGQHG